MIVCLMPKHSNVNWIRHVNKCFSHLSMLLYNMVACFNAIDGIAQLAMTNYYRTNNMVYDVKS